MIPLPRRAEFKLEIVQLLDLGFEFWVNYLLFISAAHVGVLQESFRLNHTLLLRLCTRSMQDVEDWLSVDGHRSPHWIE